ASVLGAVVGVAVLSQVLPRVIHNAYGIVYFVPEGGYPINWGVAAFATLLGVGIILLSTWWAAASTLRQRPGELLLPRAPKAGKRIFLEHVPIIWNNLSFSWKVTCRNLFRYKKRLIMTVIGIAGCTALLVTGWGLRDAINDIIDIQFGRIVSYNLTISTDEEMSEEAEAAMHEVLDDPTFVEESTPVRKVTVLGVPVDGGTDITVEVIVPKSRMAFADFVETRNRTTGEWLELGASGVVVTEKLAKLLGVGVGDRILLYDQDATGNRTDTAHSMRVAGIMENYIYDYVYVAPDLYEEIWGEAPAYNLILAKATDDAAAREELTERLRAVDGVRTVGFTDEIIDTFRTMLSVVDLITWVLIIAAAALAFIVLWNLTNINITEREREIATLKVLGFTRHDVYAYIYREVALLTILGAAVGILLGIWLEGWVVVTAEVDQVMFGRTIHTASYLISLGLTGIFAAFVMLIMRHKLDRVNMVESLKSVE
ncbi:MAG: ABC transporter permease, partial [Eggerthellaceae bacterium]|nr:ABC transporter permease [Eggerthellaceae bacterium]